MGKKFKKGGQPTIGQFLKKTRVRYDENGGLKNFKADPGIAKSSSETSGKKVKLTKIGSTSNTDVLRQTTTTTTEVEGKDRDHPNSITVTK